MKITKARASLDLDHHIETCTHNQIMYSDCLTQRAIINSFIYFNNNSNYTDTELLIATCFFYEFIH